MTMHVFLLNTFLTLATCPGLGCYNQKDVNVEGSKDGRWLVKGRAEPFIAFCIIRITA